jgi:hypothetical protein
MVTNLPINSRIVAEIIPNVQQRAMFLICLYYFLQLLVKLNINSLYIIALATWYEINFTSQQLPQQHTIVSCLPDGQLSLTMREDVCLGEAD